MPRFTAIKRMTLQQLSTSASSAACFTSFSFLIKIEKAGLFEIMTICGICMIKRAFTPLVKGLIFTAIRTLHYQLLRYSVPFQSKGLKTLQNCRLGIS